MFKKILFCSLIFLIFLITLKQKSNAKTWENCKVPADSIIAAINRGDTVTINGGEVVGTLSITGTPQKPFTIKSPITGFGNIFTDSVFFYRCDFLSEIDLPGASFKQFVAFGDVTFKKGVYFLMCEFDDRTYFGLCKFKMGAYFEASTFTKFTSFVADTFLDTASFMQDTFHGVVSFLDTHYRKGVNFAGVDFGEISVFVRTQFDGKVNLTSTHFEKIIILWKQMEGRLICDNLTCLKLMKHFDEQRMLDDVDGVYLFLKNQERMEKPWYYRYPEFWLIQLTCGYGIVWWRPLVTSMVIVILFTILYFIFVLQEKGLSLPNSGSKRFWKKLWNAFYYSINTFIVGIPANWKVENKPRDFFAFRVLTTMERTLGWILLAVFVVTLTRKFIR